MQIHKSQWQMRMPQQSNSFEKSMFLFMKIGNFDCQKAKIFGRLALDSLNFCVKLPVWWIRSVAAYVCGMCVYTSKSYSIEYEQRVQCMNYMARVSAKSLLHHHHTTTNTHTPKEKERNTGRCFNTSKSALQLHYISTYECIEAHNTVWCLWRIQCMCTQLR